MDEPTNETVLCEVCKIRYVVTAIDRKCAAACIDCLDNMKDEREESLEQ